MHKAFLTYQAITHKFPEAAQECSELDLPVLTRYFWADGDILNGFQKRIYSALSFSQACVATGNADGLRFVRRALLVAGRLLAASGLSGDKEPQDLHFLMVLAANGHLALDEAQLQANQQRWTPAFKFLAVAREVIAGLRSARDLNQTPSKLKDYLPAKWLYLACEFECRAWLFGDVPGLSAADPHLAISELRQLNTQEGADPRMAILASIEVAKLCLLRAPKLFSEAQELAEKICGQTLDGGWRVYERNEEGAAKLAYYPYLELALWREVVVGRPSADEIRRLFSLREESLAAFYGEGVDLSAMRTANMAELPWLLRRASGHRESRRAN